MMKTTLSALVLAGLACTAHAATVTIEALDVRSGGVYGHNANVGDPPGNVTINGVPAPNSTIVNDVLDVAVTYNNLDLDGDGNENDSVDFTLRFSGSGQRIFGQGVDTGFGSLNDVTVSVMFAGGQTTDLGQVISFDGFTGGAIGAGNNGLIDRTAEINGNAVAVNIAATGAFEFGIDAVDFAPTATILYDNSGGTSGSVVARHHDLQFSTPLTIPEPASALMVLGGVALLAARRK